MSKSKNAKTLLTKAFSLLAAASMVQSAGISAFAANESNQNNGYADGVYQGTAKGYKSDITVNVKIQDGKISEVTEVSQNETASYWSKAKTLFNTIVEKQSADVDGVSRATYSSNGIKNAVAAALKDASAANEQFSGGTGTAEDPFIISGTQQLKKFAESVNSGNTFEGQYIALSKNIDLSEQDNWDPIGDISKNASNIFQGTFDGKGFTINGLNISGEYTAEANVGLFSSLGVNSIVKNINLTNVKIAVSGSDIIRAGAIAGDMPTGSSDKMPVIDNCSATGSVDVAVSDNKLAFAGGIVGRLQANTAVVNSWTDTAVSAFTSGTASAYAAGIAGTTGNNTLVANCAAFGTSYANAPLNSNFGGMAGGISAMFAGKLWNVYTTGNSTIGSGGSKHSWVGAIAGDITTSGMTKNGNDYVYPSTGALRDFGYYSNDTTLTKETWSSISQLSSTETAELAAAGTGTVNYDKEFKGTAMNRADMATDEFANTLNDNLKTVNKLLNSYDIKNIELRTWTLAGGKILPNGKVWEDSTPDSSIFAGGKGTKEEPFLIETSKQLGDFAGSLNGGVDYSGYYVKLNSNVDISGTNWKPIGGSDYAFNGNFDGAGYTISGLTEGSENSPLELDENNVYIGLFGALNEDAIIKNVKLDKVSIYVKYNSAVYVGGIAGIMQGALVDGCSVSGVIKVNSDKQNCFAAGLVSYQYKGAIINSMSNTDISCSVASGNGLAEVGGLVSLNNRGLVANCYSLGNVYGSSSRTNGDEGMAVVSSLIAVNAGSLANCYGAGSHTTGEFSTYTGAVTGWVTGIGKSYNCLYNGDAVMKIGDQIVDPVESIGTKVASGVSDDGLTYTGGVVDKLTAYRSAEYTSIAEKLNADFTKFPIDISAFGLEANALKTWEVKDGVVTLSDNSATVSYKKPDPENVPVIAQVMRDGIWYGRDDAKTTVVRIKVENDKITETTTLKGESSGEAYEAALEKAKEKSIYGDTSNYNAFDPTKFAGGKGTQAEPYLISNETQLRYIAEALNEDVTFDGVYFKQTANITLGKTDWLPIGWGIMTEINNRATQYSMYPFLGNYDGSGYTISDLKIGTKEKASEDPRVSYTAGFFGTVSGENGTNDAPTEDMRISKITNINLKNITVNVSSRYQNFVGGLAGSAQNGFEISNCSVSGTVISRSEESFARAGGLIANALRGVVTNSKTQVNVTATTDAGQCYVGGFYGMDNRVTTVNSYAAGNITADAGNNNKIHIGGFCGMSGGAKYNCYACGDVVSYKTTTDLGGFNGRLAGIGVDNNCYFNSDAKQEIAGASVETKAASGVVVSEDENANITFAKTKAELSSEAFAKLLNENKANTLAGIDTIKAVVADCSMPYAILYTGNGSNLTQWKLTDGVVGFSTVKELNAQTISTAKNSFAKTYGDKAFSLGAKAKGKLSYRSNNQKVAVVNANGVVTIKGAGTATITIKSAATDDYKAAVKTVKITVAKSAQTIALSKTKYAKKSGDKAFALNAKLSSKDKNAKLTYVSSNKKAVVVSAAGKVTIKGVGTSKITIKSAATANAKAAVSKTVIITVSPKTVKVTGLKAVKGGKLTVKWSKNPAVTGYQFQYGQKKTFKGAKTVTVRSAKTVNKTVSNLKKNKTYFIRVRTYKKVSGKTYFSGWSTIKSVKAK